MAWVRAVLRGQKVFARADANGVLSVNGGRVEIRYKPNDGRRYEARAQNLAVVPGEVLPDEACGAAEAATKPASKVAAKATKRSSTRGSASASPSEPPDGTIIAYADGACSGNPGPAGLGVVVIDRARRIEISEYLGHGTNNIAELTAVLRALGEGDASTPIVIYTDSQYTIGVVQKGWKAKANAELVTELREALEDRGNARLVYVPGHSGVVLNERADALAREAVTARASRRAVFESAKPEPEASA